jgi:hypothetical protein
VLTAAEIEGFHARSTPPAPATCARARCEIELTRQDFWEDAAVAEVFHFGRGIDP